MIRHLYIVLCVHHPKYGYPCKVLQCKSRVTFSPLYLLASIPFNAGIPLYQTFSSLPISYSKWLIQECWVERRLRLVSHWLSWSIGPAQSSCFLLLLILALCWFLAPPKLTSVPVSPRISASAPTTPSSTLNLKTGKLMCFWGQRLSNERV